MYIRDDCYPLIRDGLAKSYGMKDFTIEEYDDLCHRARKFQVLKIIGREPRENENENGSFWYFCIMCRGVQVYLRYLTPEDVIETVLLPEHFARRFDEEPEEPVVVKKPRRKKEEKDEDDLLVDLKEIGVDV